MEMTLPRQVRDVVARTESRQPALVVTPHPLTCAGRRVLDSVAAEFTPGESLAALLARNGVRRGEQWQVAIGGIPVAEEHWHRVRPKHGHLIEARRVPQKDVLRIVAFAALSYFTMGAGGIAGGSFLGLTGAAGWVAATAAFVAGSLVLNKMLAPKQVGGSESTASPTYSLSGGRNRMRPYEAMPLVLGEPYAVPDLASQPYTYFASGEQYLWQMFHVGLNCAEVGSLRIGQTALDAYQGVTVLRNGLATGNADFPALGTSVDSVQGALITPGVYTTRTSSVDTVRLSIDLVATLFSTTKAGAFANMGLDVVAEYRAVGASTWLPFTPYVPAVPAVIVDGWSPPADDSGGGLLYWQRVVVPAVAEVPAGYIRLVNASQKPLRVTVDCAVAPGQYEVRVIKGSPDYVGTQGSNNVEWVQLKSYQNDNANYSGQSRIAINIQASGQLNGALDEVNCQLRARPMPCWNGSGWVDAVDRATGLCNPGAIFLLLSRGIYDDDGRLIAGMGYSDDRIDIEGLKLFMVHCAEKGFHFDLFLQDATSIEDLLEVVAYAGLGEKAWPDGKLGVIFFRRDAPIEGVINMASQTTRSFSVDYATMPTADELEVEYFDRDRGNSWQPVRVLAPGVVIPRSPSSTKLTGVTGEAHAALLARFMMAQNIYQRKTVTCDQDLEYMTHPKGTVTAFSHDLTQWGYGGRLAGFQDVGGVITLALDDIAPGALPVGATARFIGLRLPGETQLRVFPVASFVGEARTVTLSVPWPVGVTQPGSSDDNLAHDTLWIYDFKEVPGQRLVVSSVEPSANGGRLALVPVSEEFWNFVETGEYLPPPNNSLLRSAPVVTGLLVSEQLARQGNTFYTELTVDFEVTGPFVRAELWGAVGEGEASPTQRLLASGSSQSLSWQGGLDERWHLELRAYSESRASVPFRLFFDVQGLRAPPPDVTDLVVNGDAVSWSPAEVPDLAGYLIRFQYGDNVWWDTAVQLHSGVVTESPYTLARRPQGDVTVLVKAIDTTGNESVNAAAFRYGFSEIVVRNPVVLLEQHPLFAGDISGGAVVGGDLVADDLDEFYEPADGPMYLPEAEPMYGTSQYGQLVYEFSVDSTERGILVLQYTISAESLLIEYQTGGSEPMYEPASDLMYEPSGEPMYGSLGEWSVWPGSLDFDGVTQVRFRLTLAAGLSQGVIYNLAALIDAPEITEVIDDAVIAPGGVRLPLTNTYRVIRSVQLTVQSDGGAGVTPRLIDKNATLGPMVEILNTSGVAVAGRLDAEIRGY